LCNTRSIHESAVSDDAINESVSLDAINESVSLDAINESVSCNKIASSLGMAASSRDASTSLHVALVTLGGMSVTAKSIRKVTCW
jgi:hypothetical protein